MSDGNVEMVLDIEAGRVVMHFKEPMQTIKFDPKNLVDIACRMTDLAFEAENQLKPAGDTLKAELIERHRMKLTQRVAVMLNGLREDKKKSNGQIAQSLVEECLKEIF